MSEVEEETYGKVSIWESLQDDPRNDMPAGTRYVKFGTRPDPDYTVLTESGVKEITHEQVIAVDLPGKMSKEEIREYLQEEVLPLDD